MALNRACTCPNRAAHTVEPDPHLRTQLVDRHRTSSVVSATPECQPRAAVVSTGNDECTRPRGNFRAVMSGRCSGFLHGRRFQRATCNVQRPWYSGPCNLAHPRHPWHPWLPPEGGSYGRKPDTRLVIRLAHANTFPLRGRGSGLHCSPCRVSLAEERGVIGAGGRTTRPSLLLRTSTSRTCIDASRRRRPISASTSTTISSRTTRGRRSTDAVAAARAFRERVSAIDRRIAVADNQLDREQLLHAIDSRLLTLEVVRPWAQRSRHLQQRPDQHRLHHDQARRSRRPKSGCGSSSRARRRCRRRSPRRARTSRIRRASTPRSPSSSWTATASSSRRPWPRRFPDVTDKALLAEFKTGQRRRHRRARRLQEMAAERSAEAIERRVSRSARTHTGRSSPPTK